MLAALNKSIYHETLHNNYNITAQQQHIKSLFLILFGMGFIAVFIEVYFARLFGRQNEGNFDRFKRYLVPKISGLKPYQTGAHLLKYIPEKFGGWKLSLVSAIK